MSTWTRCSYVREDRQASCSCPVHRGLSASHSTPVGSAAYALAGGTPALRTDASASRALGVGSGKGAAAQAAWSCLLFLSEGLVTDRADSATVAAMPTSTRSAIPTCSR